MQPKVVSKITMLKAAAKQKKRTSGGVPSYNGCPTHTGGKRRATTDRQQTTLRLKSSPPYFLGAHEQKRSATHKYSSNPMHRSSRKQETPAKIAASTVVCTLETPVFLTGGPTENIQTRPLTGCINPTSKKQGAGCLAMNPVTVERMILLCVWEEDTPSCK